MRIHSVLHHGAGEGSFLCGARGHGWSLGGVILLHSHACWLFVPELLAFESSGSMANEVRWAWLQPEDGAVSTARWGLYSVQPPTSLTSGATALGRP